jgi:hypothetical protein
MLLDGVKQEHLIILLADNHIVQRNKVYFNEFRVQVKRFLCAATKLLWAQFGRCLMVIYAPSGLRLPNVIS